MLEIPLDETELKISQRKIIDRFGRKGKRRKVVHVNTTVPALTVHGSIQFSSGDVASSQEIVVPMIAMEAKNRCMHAQCNQAGDEGGGRCREEQILDVDFAHDE